MKSQSTSKTREMDWEKKFEEEFCKLATYEYEPTPIFIDKTKQVKAFIRTAINQAIAQERERIYNTLMAKQELVTYKKDNGHGVAVPCSHVINIITNNHEDHKE